MKITLSKSQWMRIGQNAGWMKNNDQSSVSKVVKVVQELMEREKRFRQHNADIPDMDEATPADLDAGYGQGMSAEDYTESLYDPYVQIIDYTKDRITYKPEPDEFRIYFIGNYEPSSVNAGRMRKIYLGTVESTQQLVEELQKLGMKPGVDIVLP